jgi:hypothetical protein
MNAKRADLCWRTESRAESTLKPRRAAAVQIEDERLPFVAAEVFELRPGLLCGVDVHGNAALSEGREGRRFGERFEPRSDRREPRQTGVAASALSGLPHGSGVSYRFASQKRCPSHLIAVGGPHAGWGCIAGILLWLSYRPPRRRLRREC